MRSSLRTHTSSNFHLGHGRLWFFFVAIYVLREHSIASGVVVRRTGLNHYLFFIIVVTV